MTKQLENVEVIEKDTAKFVTQLSKPNEKVEWFVAGKKVEPSDKYEIESHDLDYTLIIHDCGFQDDLAEVSLTIGDQKTTGQLTVLGNLSESTFRHYSMTYMYVDKSDTLMLLLFYQLIVLCCFA